jgi:hypothetical protein
VVGGGTPNCSTEGKIGGKSDSRHATMRTYPGSYSREPTHCCRDTSVVWSYGQFALVSVNLVRAQDLAKDIDSVCCLGVDRAAERNNDVIANLRQACCLPRGNRRGNMPRCSPGAPVRPAPSLIEGIRILYWDETGDTEIDDEKSL